MGEGLRLTAKWILDACNIQLIYLILMFSFRVDVLQNLFQGIQARWNGEDEVLSTIIDAESGAQNVELGLRIDLEAFPISNWAMKLGRQKCNSCFFTSC